MNAEWEVTAIGAVQVVQMNHLLRAGIIRKAACRSCAWMRAIQMGNYSQGSHNQKGSNQVSFNDESYKCDTDMWYMVECQKSASLDMPLIAKPPPPSFWYKAF